MEIRRATHADSDGMSAVHREAIQGLCRLHYTQAELDAWSGRKPERRITHPIDTMDCFVVVDASETIVGFAIFQPEGSRIRAVYVHPESAHRGLGTALLRHLEAHAREGGRAVVTLQASLNAVDFYFRHGYVPTGSDRHVSPGGVSLRCIAMSKPLAPGVTVAVEPQMPVFLVPHDPTWAAAFDREDAAIRAALGDAISGVEHIGSTAIPGLDAKPVIDVLVLVPDIARAPYLFEPLESLGYHYFPYDERAVPERRWFCKPSAAHRTHHLHLVVSGSAKHRDTLLFRDHLRTNAAARDRYQTLKRELAERFAEDREAYTDAKGAFVRDVLSAARGG